MANANFDALVDFVRDNPRGMDVVKYEEGGRIVLRTLAEGGMAARPLLVRAKGHRHTDHWLRFLRAHFRETSRWPEFVEAIFVVFWKKPADPGHTVMWEVLMNPKAVPCFLGAHWREFYDHYYEFPASLDMKTWPDPYWLVRVRRFIATGNERRAWGELGRARRGFHLPQRPGRPMEHVYCFPASTQALYSLTTELHNLLVERGKLPPSERGVTSLDRLGSIREPDPSDESIDAALIRYFAPQRKAVVRRRHARKLREYGSM